jgi:hypothetical protein
VSRRACGEGPPGSACRSSHRVPLCTVPDMSSWMRYQPDIPRICLKVDGEFVHA